MFHVVKGEIVNKEDYKLVDFVIASTIDEAVKTLLGFKKQGIKAYGVFNGKELYSDTVTLDSAYLEITGKTKEEHEEYQRKWKEDYDRQQNEHKETIPSLTKVWMRKARGIIKEDKLDYWDKIVPIRLGDLYQGMELGCTIDIGKLLNENKLDEAKELMISKGHSGTSWGLVKSMVKQFCNNGKEFCDILD